MRFRWNGIASRKLSSLKRSCAAFRPITRAAGAPEVRRDSGLREDMQDRGWRNGVPPQSWPGATVGSENLDRNPESLSA